MNLRCAIVECASSWVALLSQEGVPWVRANFETLEPEDVSVLIVDRRLQGAEQERVKAYLAGGGAVLGAARFLSSATHMPTRREYVRYLTDDREDPWIELLDVSQVCDIPKEAGVLRTQDNVFGVFAGEVGGGAAILLPFDVSDLWLKEGATNRKFPSPFERLPYERVAVASRSELHRLVHHSLQFLHLHRSVPYVRLRPYPGDTLAMAAFRLDTDRASRRQIAAFYELSQSLSIPFTWFLDTYSHESWLGEFASMQGQEIGVHCYAHKTHKTLADARNDIERAQKLLRDAGIAIGGYAAPYGIWSTTLGETL